MILYFSGISSPAEFSMLRQAKVKHILVDQFDLKFITGWSRKKALDSGAYKAFKTGGSLDLKAYVALLKQCSRFDFLVSLDVIGDAEQSYYNYERMRSEVPVAPVWHWGSDFGYLDKYLSCADLIGIGGLVPLMRQKDEKMLDAVLELCKTIPNRFHIFGLNWLKAMEVLKPYIRSADTSKWLDAARYGHLIFINDKNGHLSQCPVKVLIKSGHASEELTDRVKRCVVSARNMEKFMGIS